MLIARLCLMLALLLLPWLGGSSGVLPLAVLALLAAGGWVGWAVAKPRPALSPLPLRWPLCVLAGVTLAATLTSVYRPASMLGVYQLLIVISLTALACCLPLARAQLFTGVLTFAASLLTNVLYGLLSEWYALLGRTHGLAHLNLMALRVQSTWENANFYAGFLLIALPVLAVYARHALRPFERRFAAPRWCARRSRCCSRSHAAGCWCFSSCCCSLPRRGCGRKGNSPAAGWPCWRSDFVVLVGLALLSPVGKRVLNPRVRAQQLHSQMFRYYTWRGALRMMHAYPWLGSGPNTFPSAFGNIRLPAIPTMRTRLPGGGGGNRGHRPAGAALAAAGGVADGGARTAAGTLRELPAAERTLLTSIAVAQCASTLGLLLHGLVDSDWRYPGIQLFVLLQAVLAWRLLTPPRRAAHPAPRWLPIGVPARCALSPCCSCPVCGRNSS